MISQERVKELLDYVEGGLYWKVSTSNRVKVGERAGTLEKTGYRRIKVDGKYYREHQLVFLYHEGWIPKLIDHRDGERGNNMFENLREACFSTNAMNSTIRKNNSSGVKGVYWHKAAKKWCVEVKAFGKRVHRSWHSCLELSELVAIEARKTYHGEFFKNQAFKVGGKK